MDEKYSEINMNKDSVKILSIVILGLGSFLAGMAPAWFSRRNQRRNPLLITILLCFGAGVLLATSIVHMLAEVKEDLPKYAELVFCAGFFLVYVVDELVHFCCGEAIQHTHSHNIDRQHTNTHNHEHQDHQHQKHNVHQRRNSLPTGNRVQYGSDQETQTLLGKPEQLSDSERNCDENTENANARICHVSHEEPCESNIVGVLGLLCALSLHSFIEGLAIGVQDTGTRVLILLIAVSSHKFVVSFCLGIELSANANSRLRSHLISMFVFSFGSVLGILIGICLVDFQSTLSSTTIPVLQGVAGGTLLYVTVCEVLPREKARWHQNQSVPSAGLIQLFSVIVGFSTMTLLNHYLGD